jgi:Hint domain-containing protein
MARFLIRKDIMRDDTVSRARRHFFYVVSTLAGAAVWPAISKPAKAGQGGNGQGGNGQGGNGRGGNGQGGGGHCMLRGTRILTSHGAERVESLSIGDRVVTACGEKPIKWIGRQHFGQGRSALWPEGVHPVRVSRSALADNVPHADLYLSPMHAVLIDDVLIEAKDLVNFTSITRAVPEGMTDIEYFHIELETHEVIFAEGALVETLLVTHGRESFSNFVEYERLYGRDTGPAMVPYAPVLAHSSARAHLKALLRLGVSQVIDVRDPIQIAYDRIAARAACLVA